MFRDCIAQASWTKVSMASILSSLYPTAHGVALPEDRLPTAAVTLPEVCREAGYATLSLSSIFFSDRSTNLHQGFEELHEGDSLIQRQPSKTARPPSSRSAVCRGLRPDTRWKATPALWPCQGVG